MEPATSGVALAGWGDLAPLILLLIFSAVVNWQKRKKEQAASREGAANGSDASSPERSRTQVSGRADPVRPLPREHDDGEYEEDWSGEDWAGEHSDTWDDHKGRETRSTEVRSPENRSESLASRPKDPVRPPETDVKRSLPTDRGQTAPPQMADKAKEKAAEVGRDILSQLAKELGLELPPGGKPAPRPSTPAPTPAPQAPAAKSPSGPSTIQPRSHSVSPDEVRARAAEAGRTRSLQEGRAPAVPSASHPAPYAIKAPTGPGKPLLSPGDFSDPEALRRAFILKTILDKPLSLRPRGNGSE